MAQLTKNRLTKRNECNELQKQRKSQNNSILVMEYRYAVSLR